MGRDFVPSFIASILAGLVLLLFRLLLDALTPPEVLSDWIVRRIPLQLFQATLETFGSRAKPLLAASLAIALIMAASLFGMVWRRLQRKWSGSHGPTWLVVAAPGLILWLLAMTLVMKLSGRGFFAASSQTWPASTAFAWLVSSLIYALALYRIRFSHPKAPLRVDEAGPDSTRRLFIKRLGLAAAGVAIASGAGVGLWKLVSGFAASVTSSLSWGKLRPEVTPNDDFYAVSKGFTDPVVDDSSWKLKVTGLVENKLVLDYQDMKQLPSVTQYVTLECISNPVGGPLIGNALWKGVRLRNILSRAGVKESVTKVVLIAADEYSDSISLDRAVGNGTFLAYEMNGVPLSKKHGFPARLLVPGIYGMKNVKWLTEIRLVDYDYMGYWQMGGWSDQAIVSTMSRIDVPHGPGSYQYSLEGGEGKVVTDPRQASQALIGGIAFAGDNGISLVEVSTDGGQSWRPARVKEALSPYTWVLWVYDWTSPGEGEYVIKVRAVDGKGVPQIAQEADPLPEGATGYHTIKIKLQQDPGL